MKHSDDKGSPRVTQSTQAATRSERRQASDAEADPPVSWGRLPATGKRATRAPVVSAGVLAAACVREGDRGNTGSPVGGAHAPTGSPRGTAWAGGVADRPVVAERPGIEEGGRGRGEWRKSIPPLSVRIQRAPHAEARGPVGRDSGKSGAVGNDRAALPVAAPRRPVGAGETCAPRTRAGDRATPAGTVRAGLSVGEGHDPG